MSNPRNTPAEHKRLKFLIDEVARKYWELFRNLLKNQPLLEEINDLLDEMRPLAGASFQDHNQPYYFRRLRSKRTWKHGAHFHNENLATVEEVIRGLKEQGNMPGNAHKAAQVALEAWIDTGLLAYEQELQEALGRANPEVLHTTASALPKPRLKR